MKERMGDDPRLAGINAANQWEEPEVSEGSFEYVPGNVDVEDFSAPIDTLILSVVSMGDEMKDLREPSPVHPDTVYALPDDFENMPGDIRKFLKVAGPLLVKGGSTRKIHEETGLDRDTVCEFMTVLDTMLLGRVIGLLRRVGK